MININEAYDIVSTGFNDPEQPKHPLQQPPGPSEEIRPEDYGTDLDFEVYDHGETSVFYPVSKAALKWGDQHLPADSDRWRGVGFIVEAEWIDLVCRQARMDKLVSLDDALHEEQEQQRGMT